MNNQVNEIIKSSETEIGLVFHDKIKRKLKLYFEYLLDWNKKINLISRKSESSVLSTALIESYALFEIIRDYSGDFLDVGSGGGLPGIIISILLPEAKIELLDSIRKKAVFMESAISHLKLSNITAVNKRLEELPESKKYDLIFSRGVGNFENLRNHYFRLIKNSGSIFILTGEDNSKLFRKYEILQNPFLHGRIIVNLEK
ncbi:MAG: 16S rRNA (guanine(527)-N(7))-methyltransferase RsmG [Candidatus Delongbacteria bacterium]|nr:16S rRNA (guanine(527)-N(7))-methyltransferase RsmG [Candidatus Delongbacteria bacterium]MCG2761002.1 16S rRNA (guanine(527)-N(7))-methyltransferase RsmG [Candidatus Delongbacteria bacterium]